MECLQFKEKHKIRTHTDTDTFEEEGKILERDLEEILTWKTKEEEEEISTTVEEIVQTEEAEIAITEKEGILTSEEEGILTSEEEEQSSNTEEMENKRTREEPSKTEEGESLKTQVEEICDTAEDVMRSQLLTLLHTLLLLTSWPTHPALTAVADMSDLEAKEVEVAAAVLLLLAGVLGGEAATEQRGSDLVQLAATETGDTRGLTTETAGEVEETAAATPPAPEKVSVLFWPADTRTRMGEGEDGATLV